MPRTTLCAPPNLCPLVFFGGGCHQVFLLPCCASPRPEDATPLPWLGDHKADNEQQGFTRRTMIPHKTTGFHQEPGLQRKQHGCTTSTAFHKEQESFRRRCNWAAQPARGLHKEQQGFKGLTAIKTAASQGARGLQNERQGFTKIQMVPQGTKEFHKVQGDTTKNSEQEGCTKSKRG